MPIPDQDTGPLQQGQTMASPLGKVYAEAMTPGQSCARVSSCLTLDRRGFMPLQLRRREWSGRQGEGESRYFRLHSAHFCSICPAMTCPGTGKLKWGTHFQTRRLAPLRRDQGQCVHGPASGPMIPAFNCDFGIQNHGLVAAWAVSKDILCRLPGCVSGADNAAAYCENPGGFSARKAYM